MPELLLGTSLFLRAAGHKRIFLRMKIVLDLRVSLDINEAGESDGLPMRNNREENRDAFSGRNFGHCFYLALSGDSLPIRRLGGECAGDP